MTVSVKYPPPMASFIGISVITFWSPFIPEVLKDTPVCRKPETKLMNVEAGMISEEMPGLRCMENQHAHDYVWLTGNLSIGQELTLLSIYKDLICQHSFQRIPSRNESSALKQHGIRHFVQCPARMRKQKYARLRPWMHLPMLTLRFI